MKHSYQTVIREPPTAYFSDSDCTPVDKCLNLCCAVCRCELSGKIYTGEYIFHFIEDIADNFDWGWDFTECGVLKFYNSEVPELMSARYVFRIARQLEDTG